MIRSRLAASAAMAVFMATATLMPAQAQPADGWVGEGVLTGGKGYAATPLGQIHYRDVGPRDARVTLLLIHQTWMSMIEFAEAQNALTALGYRSIAIDLPGHGMSDQPDHVPSVAEIADAVAPVLKTVGVSKAVIVGHHTGAAMAAAFAARHPEYVRAVILHGSPFFSPEEAKRFQASPNYDRTPVADGAHMARWFSREMPGDPKPNTTVNLRSRTWMLISKFQMGDDYGLKAVFANDMTPDIRGIRAPTLILTDSGDSLRTQDLKVAALRPDFSYQVFSDSNNMALMNQPARWAQTVDAWLKKTLP